MHMHSMQGHIKKMATYKSRKEASEDTNPAWISSLHSNEEINFYFKAI